MPLIFKILFFILHACAIFIIFVVVVAVVIEHFLVYWFHCLVRPLFEANILWYLLVFDWLLLFLCWLNLHCLQPLLYILVLFSNLRVRIEMYSRDYDCCRDINSFCLIFHHMLPLSIWRHCVQTHFLQLVFCLQLSLNPWSFVVDYLKAYNVVGVTMLCLESEMNENHVSDVMRLISMSSYT